MGNILQVSHVDRRFRTGFWLKAVDVLRDVSFEVPERSVFGFLGANGAGKTTLIHLIVGLHRPTRGDVMVAGHPASSISARAKVGYLPERPYFYEHLTGESLLRFFGSLSGLNGSLLRERITQVLSVVGMTQARDVELRRYSKGMLQRIGIAQAILHEPEFLVLDEPMSGLDPTGRKEIRELITRLAADGHTVFFSSHVIPDVESICDRVALIRSGKIVCSGALHDLLPQGEMRAEIGLGGVTPKQAQLLAGVTSVRAIPEGVRAVVTGQTALDATLCEVYKEGGQVLWVNPLRPSLEELFERGNG